MPSASLRTWTTDRTARLVEIEKQCAMGNATTPANPILHDENLRALILLLSAHFQGFCRDLYTECSQIVVGKVRPTLQSLIQQQFSANCSLNSGNPNIDNIKKDYKRFGFPLDLAAIDPANHAHLANLRDLNIWRNIAAHQGVVPPAGLPPLASIQSWRHSCGGLATSLDAIMYNQLRKILSRPPWTP